MHTAQIVSNNVVADVMKELKDEIASSGLDQSVLSELRKVARRNASRDQLTSQTHLPALPAGMGGALEPTRAPARHGSRRRRQAAAGSVAVRRRPADGGATQNRPKSHPACRHCGRAHLRHTAHRKHRHLQRRRLEVAPRAADPYLKTPEPRVRLLPVPACVMQRLLCTEKVASPDCTMWTKRRSPFYRNSSRFYSSACAPRAEALLRDPGSRFRTDIGHRSPYMCRTYVYRRARCLATAG